MVLAVLLFGCFSCNDIPGTYQVRVTVLDADTWSPENSSCSVAEGALVLLFDESDMLLKEAAPGDVSDAAGVALVTNRLSGAYYLEVTKDNSANVISREEQNGYNIGYVIVGVVRNPAEAEILPLQFGKRLVPGDVIIRDANSDGVINELDKILGYRIDVSGNQDYTIYIADQDSFK